jgi:hypothetical protein
MSARSREEISFFAQNRIGIYDIIWARLTASEHD